MILLPCAAQATHFYPRSPCGERPVGCLVSMPPWCISIHALLAESDFPAMQILTSRLEFLSTLSLRRATRAGWQPWTVRRYFYPRSPCGERQICSCSCVGRNRNFYPRSPCGERRSAWRLTTPITGISIHALLAESDSMVASRYTRGIISIHALLAESDLQRVCVGNAVEHFYPRSPCGERHIDSVPPASRKIFLSTLSLRRATFLQCKY